MVRHHICAAIRATRILQFRYEGELGLVEPHVLGFDEAGELILRAWQLAGQETGWRDDRVGT